MNAPPAGDQIEQVRQGILGGPMRRLFSNRLTEALVRTIFMFGVIHITILCFEAARGDFYVFNAFRIVHLDVLIPGLGDGLFNFILSQCVVLLVYCFAYRFLTRPAPRQA